MTLAEGVLTLLYDTYIHTDDINAALGWPSDRGPGLQAALQHLAWALGNRGWGPATLELGEMPPIAVRGGGRVISGDPLTFALAASGRVVPDMLGLDATVNIFA